MKKKRWNMGKMVILKFKRKKKNMWSFGKNHYCNIKIYLIQSDVKMSEIFMNNFFALFF